MDRLKDYCIEVRDIDGLRTYIISSDYLDNFLSDKDLLASLFVSPESIQYMVNQAKENPSKVFFAFVQRNNVNNKRFVWQPVNCYKNGDIYCHIFIRDSWMCRECNHINRDKFIMPMVEHETIFYVMEGIKYPPILSVFKRRICEKCGKTLQNHFVSL